MNDAMRPNERIAAADLVQWAAVMFAHGVRKVFYHAGVCQGYHQDSTGNMFFDTAACREDASGRGGDGPMAGPRLPVPPQVGQAGVAARLRIPVQGPHGCHLVDPQAGWPEARRAAGLRALDLMGNAIPSRRIVPGEEPMYLVGE